MGDEPGYYDSVERDITLVFAALERSALAAESFTICLGFLRHKRILEVVGTQVNKGIASTAFCQLKKLRLDFYYQEGTPTNAVIDNFCELLGSVPSLHDLIINVQFECRWAWRPDSYSRLIDKLCDVLRTKLPVLRNLDLQRFQNSDASSPGDLATHPNTRSVP